MSYLRDLFLDAALIVGCMAIGATFFAAFMVTATAIANHRLHRAHDATVAARTVPTNVRTLPARTTVQRRRIGQ